MFNKWAKGKILFIRHGETEYNKCLNIAADKKEIQIDERFLDCSLSEIGQTQAEELSEKLKNFKIKRIYCSPLNRCIETISIALKSHPQRNNIEIIIHPLITEVLHGAQDVCKSITTKKDIYSDRSDGLKFDWTLFDEYYDKEQIDYFFLEFIDNFDNDKIKDQSELIYKNIKSQAINDGLCSQLLKLFLDNSIRPESLSHLLIRANKFKKLLKEVHSNDEDEEEKILVITHSAFIRMCTTEISDTLDNKLEYYPSDCYSPGNCEIISIDI